jgi:hypothetical protein
MYQGVEEMRNVYNILFGNLDGRDRVEYLDVGGKIIL